MIVKLCVKLDNEDGEKATFPFGLDSQTEPFQLTLDDPTVRKCVEIAMKKFNSNVNNVIITTTMQYK